MAFIKTTRNVLYEVPADSVASRVTVERDYKGVRVNQEDDMLLLTETQARDLRDALTDLLEGASHG